jgi:hypothetical protein
MPAGESPQQKDLLRVATVGLLSASLLLAVIVPTADAATITVTGTADGTLVALAGNGTCDLREAIEAANTNASVGECTAGDSGLDTLAFNIGAGGLQTISLVSPLQEVSQVTIIDGRTQPGCGSTPCIELD